jgi:hypothetical protein
MTALDPPLAFVVEPHDRPALEVRVNFGVFAARQASPAEIDELARLLLDDVGAVTVVAEERHEFDGRLETSVHLVRILLAEEQLPSDAGDRTRLGEDLVARAEYWARACFAGRPGPGLEG